LKGKVVKKNTKIGLGHRKIFFSRTPETEILRFTLKLLDIVQIQVCANHDSRGSNGATVEKQQRI
jgi:hypothetical protein